jgi:hypothetical protein
MLYFADGDLSMARGLKKRQRLQSALAVGDGTPNFVHTAAGRRHDSKTGDDWKTGEH